MPLTTPNLGLRYPQPPRLQSHSLDQDVEYLYALLRETWDILDAQFPNVAWGNILGTLSDQTDLQAALDAKQDV